MKSLEFVIEIFLLLTTVLGFIDSISLCASSNKLDSSFPGASELVQSLQFQMCHYLWNLLNETKIFDRVIKSCCPSTFCKSSDECSFRECPIIHNNTESACYKNVFEILTSTLRNLSIHNIDQNCSMYDDQSEPTCDHILVTNKTKIWFRSDVVREVLNLTENGWLAGNVASYFRYTRQFSVLHGHLMFLLRNRIRVALYYGDRDATVSVFNGHWLLDELALSPIYSEFQPFHYEGQLAGAQQQFREGLTFSVVHNAGYYVAVDKPGVALKLFNDFLRGDNDNSTDVSKLSTCSKYCYPALKSALPTTYEPKLDDLEIWYWVRAYRHLYWPWSFIMPEHY